MEAAVRRRLGSLTPLAAAEILRDRTGHAFPNETSVANLFVLNAAVVQPAAGLLWHSTSMQPIAPFGEYRAFSPAEGAAGAPPLPASPRLREPAFQRELLAIAAARRAVQAQRAAARERDGTKRREALARAREIWDALASEDPPRLDPARVALGRALALNALGEREAAYEALAPAEAPAAPFEARAEGLASRALLADALGRRDEALRLWRATLAHLDAGPEFNVFDELRALAEAGLAGAVSRDELPIVWWDLGVSR
jgi:tetratricopeptide (TPR) repeat protein